MPLNVQGEQDRLFGLLGRPIEEPYQSVSDRNSEGKDDDDLTTRRNLEGFFGKPNRHRNNRNDNDDNDH